MFNILLALRIAAASRRAAFFASSILDLGRRAFALATAATLCNSMSIGDAFFLPAISLAMSDLMNAARALLSNLVGDI